MGGVPVVKRQIVLGLKGEEGFGRRGGKMNIICLSFNQGGKRGRVSIEIPLTFHLTSSNVLEMEITRYISHSKSGPNRWSGRVMTAGGNKNGHWRRRVELSSPFFGGALFFFLWHLQCC